MSADRNYRICIRCKRLPVERFDDGEPSWQCGPCNDRDIEIANERRDWDYYHPAESKHDA